MADNYLEKKMQDHAAGRCARSSAGVRLKPRLDAVVFADLGKLPPEAPLGNTVRMLAEAGAKIDMHVGADADMAIARKVAQLLGARLLPFSREDAIAYTLRTLGRIDIFLSDYPAPLLSGAQ